MNPTAADVLVVGAGPTGLALALQAHDHGAIVRVIERRVEQFRPSHALIVHPRTLEVLRPLGVTDALLDRGDIAPSVRLHLGDREIPAKLGDFALDGTAFPYLVFEAQAAVEAVLSDALAARGVEVERGAEFVGLHDERDGVVARVRCAGADELIVCHYVAACDGSNSTVRQSAGVGWQGGSYRQEVVLADIELEGQLVPGVADVVAGRNGVLFLFAAGEQATWRLLATRALGRVDRPSHGTDDPVPVLELQALVEGAGLGACVVAVAWSERLYLQHRVADRYRSGPLFLVGDAAHVHSPAGGQGMNTGIQDATNLGWKLGFAASNPKAPHARFDALDSYEIERRRVARRVVGLTHALFWAEASNDAVASFLRSSLVPIGAPLVPFLLRRHHLIGGAVRILSQFAVHYRSSPLSVEGTPRGTRGARPGERLPDETVSVEGRLCRVHELLGRPGVHVLLAQGSLAGGCALGGHLVNVHRIRAGLARGSSSCVQTATSGTGVRWRDRARFGDGST